MKKEIANEDHNTEVTGAAWTPDGSFSETFSDKNRADGKKILVENLGWSPAGCTLSGYNFVSGVSLGVFPTSIKTRCEGKAALRKGDLGVCVGGFTLASTPFTPLVCTCPIEIKDAGQSKVRGE